MHKTIAFVLGAAAGSLLTWKLVEKKYKKIADEEITSVVERFKNREKLNDFCENADHVIYASKDIVSSIEQPKDCVKTEYAKTVQELGYSDDNTENDDCTIPIETGPEKVEPFVISPEEYGDIDDYDTKSWTYYSDSVLTDETGEIVSDPEIIIGDGLLHFGDYEDDSVYVRNDNIGCDYEILKHDKTFSEIYNKYNRVDI